MSGQLRRPSSCRATGGNVRPSTSRKREGRLSSHGFDHFGVLFGRWKIEGEMLVAAGHTVHHLQNIRLGKCLHMEECSFLQGNGLTGELTYS